MPEGPVFSSGGGPVQGSCPWPTRWLKPVLPRVPQVMESVVKNCGQTVHDEVANKQTMEELKELLKVGPGGAGEPAYPRPRPCLWGLASTWSSHRSPGRTGDRKASVGGPRTWGTPA